MSLKYIDTVILESLSKEIVESVYSQIISKLEYLETEYKLARDSSEYQSNYLSSEYKRYSSLRRYVKFLHINNAYYSTVLDILKGRLLDGSLTIQLRPEPDKTREKPS